MIHRRPKWLRFLFLAPAAATAVPVFAANAEFLVQGRLVSAKSQPVAGAVVSAAFLPEDRDALAARFGEVELREAGRARSGPDGGFELVLPGEGFYRIGIRADGFLPVHESVLVPSSEPVLFLLPPLQRARKARLVVEDPAGRTVPGARIRVERQGSGWNSGGWQAFARTGEDGSAEVVLPQGGAIVAYAAAPGFATAEALIPPGAEAATLRLPAGTPLLVEVKDGRRRPLPEVSVFPADARLPLGTTGKDGTVVVPVTAAQKSFGFADLAGREGLAALRPAAGPPPQGPPRLAVELADPQPLRGRVVERATKEPVEGAWVFRFGSGGPTVARSDRAGYFELPQAQGISQDLVAALKGGYRQGYAPRAETAGELAIELEPAARLEGRVLDADGRPAGGARIVATTEDVPFEHAWPTFGVSRRDGSFALADLPVAAKVQVKAERGRLSSPVVEAEFPPGGLPATAELVLARPATVAVRVLDPRGQPVGGAEVFAANRSDPSSRLLASVDEEGIAGFEDGMWLLGGTDAEGRLAAGELTPGSYDLAARAPAFAPVVARGVAVGGAGEPRRRRAVTGLGQ